jgi:hypothetical protein
VKYKLDIWRVRTKSRKAPISFVVSVRLSGRKYHRSSPTGQIFAQFDIGDFYENLLKNSNLVKIGQKYRAPCTARHQCRGKSSLHFHGKTEHIYTVDIYKWVSNKKGRYFCVSMARIVT